MAWVPRIAGAAAGVRRESEGGGGGESRGRRPCLITTMKVARSLINAFDCLYLFPLSRFLIWSLCLTPFHYCASVLNTSGVFADFRGYICISSYMTNSISVQVLLHSYRSLDLDVCFTATLLVSFDRAYKCGTRSNSNLDARTGEKMYVPLKKKNLWIQQYTDFIKYISLLFLI